MIYGIDDDDIQSISTIMHTVYALSWLVLVDIIRILHIPVDFKWSLHFHKSLHEMTMWRTGFSS